MADSGKVIHRNFCGDCGSALFSVPDLFPGAVFVKVGCLDRASEIKPVAEICESFLPAGRGRELMRRFRC